MKSDSGAGRVKRWKASRLVTVFGPLLVLLFVILLFVGLLGWRDWGEGNGWRGVSTFLSFQNQKLVMTQTVIVAICALGMTKIIVSGGIDLSVGSVIALTSVLGAVLIRESFALGWVIAATVFAGGLVGAVNGTLVAAFRMTPFIVTLGMLGAARGIAKWVANNQTVNFDPSAISVLMADPNKDPSGLIPPLGVGITVVLVIVMAVVMRQTVFGRHIFALGSNEATARLCGVRTKRLKLAVYSVAGLFFGLAGLMQLSRLRQGDPTAAIGLELDTIAAVVIGGASLSGGTGSIVGSLVGALTMAVLRTGSQHMDWPTYMQEIIIGVLIILAVGLDKLRQRTER